MHSNPVILVTHLSKTFDGLTAVEDASFQVNPGEIFGLLGPNGAGKTTTLRILMDILKPDAGAALVLGQPPGAARRRVGYLPEERGLYRDLRVLECLVYLGQLKGLTRADAQRRAAGWLERFDLAARAKSKVQELSHGLQQKVQIIASLLHDPDLLILDEPFQGLDPVNVDAVRALIRELRAQGKTIILSAHEMSQVERLCERLALLHGGRIILYGALADLKRQFAPNALEISPPLPLEGWPEVDRVEMRDDGRQRIYLADSRAPRDLLKLILERGHAVDHFELADVSLDEIFVAAVKGLPHG